MHRFLRLWRNRGWSMLDVDKALAMLKLGQQQPEEAIPAMKNTSSPTTCGAANQIVSCCFSTIAGSESDWPMITTPSTESASETSYETSCAHVRIEPRIENFDSDAQPPTMKP